MRKSVRALCAVVPLALVLAALGAAPAPASFQLPDNRAYELVTPANKGDGTLPAEGAGYLGFQAAASGDGFAFRSFAPLPGALVGGFDTYLAARGGDGWSSHGILPSQAPVQVAGTSPVVDGYSPDLSKASFADGEEAGQGLGLGQDSPPLVPGEPANNGNLFLRDNVSGGYQLMNVTPAGLTREGPENAMYEGASADFSKILFGERAQLTPEALASGGNKFPNTGNLFQWAGGAVTLVGQIPVAPATRCGAGAAPCTTPAEGATLGGGDSNETVQDGWVHAVSPDGSRVFFRTGNSGASQLYVRENGAATVEYSASQKTNGSGPGGTDPQGPRLPTYWPASADGSQAFFTSCERLTNDSTANASESNENCEGFGERTYVFTGNDLYRFDVATGVLSDLTVDHNGDPLGADVQAVLGASADGSYVYFVANGVLASGASLGNCQFGYTPAELGQCNLYVEHGGVTKFIGPFASVGRYLESSFHATTARVTPDGTKLAFETTASPTGYDNRISSGAESCGRQLESADALGGPTGDPRCTEVYMYDAVASSLTCVSCNPTGARPLGPSHLTPIEGAASGGYAPASFVYLPRSLSADGSRLFFDSADALVPGDVNAQQDVYEYEGGKARLMSSGTSDSESTFIDASANGSDVFFTTLSQLVGQDADQQFDVYDARVGGGFPFSAPLPECVGEACKPPPAPQPAGATLGSNSLAGVGNLTPVPAPSVASPSVRRRGLTRAQKLAAALRVCRHGPRRRRGSCVARAHKLYGAVKAGKSTKSARGSK